VLAMDGDNRHDLLALAKTPEDREKIRLFRTFDPEAPSDPEVPDPYYGGDDGFAEVVAMCERASQGLLAYVRGVV